MSRAGWYRDLQVGDRVVLTEEGKGLQGRARTLFGVVKAIHQNFIRVQRDGVKEASWYHPDFWERRENEDAPMEEGIVLKNQLVNAFIQGVEWWEWTVGVGRGKLGPKDRQSAREVALIRLREGTFGVDELTKVSVDDGDFDFGGCEEEMGKK